MRSSQCAQHAHIYVYLALFFELFALTLRSTAIKRNQPNSHKRRATRYRCRRRCRRCGDLRTHTRTRQLHRQHAYTHALKHPDLEPLRSSLPPLPLPSSSLSRSESPACAADVPSTSRLLVTLADATAAVAVAATSSRTGDTTVSPRVSIVSPSSSAAGLLSTERVAVRSSVRGLSSRVWPLSRVLSSSSSSSSSRRLRLLRASSLASPSSRCER
jgi:hypothetical protein